MSTSKTPEHIKLDERNHVEKPLLDQLDGLGWEIIDLDNKQQPGDSHRENFTGVVMFPVLREQLRRYKTVCITRTNEYRNKAVKPAY